GPAEGIPPKPCEQVVEDLLADPSRSAGRQLEAFPVAGQIARALELLGERVEGFELADRVIAQVLAESRAIDRREVARLGDVAELRFEGVQRLQARHLVEGSLEAERLVAPEPEPLTEAAREELVERRGELRQVPAQP